MARFTLKMLRAKANVTQKEAAKMVGVSESTWVNWERQKSFPDVPKIREIEAAFGVPYDEIIFFDASHGLTVNSK